ncbi:MULTISPECIES: hypothetical protein [Protofrankia]|uniref:CRISPR-associated protein n=1 Tax=Protofrankia coriariae TaxID=1562887 RepID=A0ABR5F8I3_9ACTN|nr:MULTISPECIES: hypothetical protein [Protofrankia]KLL13026.1 hypothetical protein FrCorBMG51_00300 [Protofrankia coriariae]ONH38294.1 hypothetical protein BL254_00675 [Protofrankia sp. BMG5.30]
MTVHLLPCGTSILANLRPPRSVTSLESDDVRVLTDWAERTLTAGVLARPQTWAESFRDEVGPYLASITDCQRPVRLSAEVASLHRYRPFLDADDRIVLLASDTAEGVLAAVLNAARFRRPVRVHAEPVLDSLAEGVPLLGGAVGARPAEPGEPVHVLRIPRLLPDRTTTFTEAIENVAKALVWAALLHRPPLTDLVLHLSGGYKATLPYLVSFAEYVNGERPKVFAFCLHEGDAANPAAENPNELVRIYLRATRTRDDMNELAVAETGRRPKDSERLLDFAYTEVGCEVRLTPLGRGLAAMRPYLAEN